MQDTQPVLHAGRHQSLIPPAPAPSPIRTIPVRPTRWQIMKLPLHPLLLTCFLLLALPPAVQANDDDTRFLLDATRQRMEREQRGGWLPDTPSVEGRRIVIEGQEYRVGESADELALGIYYAINFQQWHKVEEFLSKYRLLAGHQPALVLLAEGLVARARGDIGTALVRLEAAEQAAPGDVRIQLELARAYAEDYQNREAIRQFDLAEQGDIPDATRQVIRGNLDAIAQRSRWHGSFSIGRGYNNNINQGNGAEQCIAGILDICFVTEALPKPIGSFFTGYQATLQRSVPLTGHHNLLLRALAYGAQYDSKDHQNVYLQDNSDNTTLLQAGYNFKNAATEFTLSPTFEHYYRDGHTNYTAPGLDLSLTHDLGPRWSLHAQGSTKRYHYSDTEKQYFADYTLVTGGFGISHNFSPLASVYAGMDWTRRKYDWDASSSREQAVRINAFKLFESGIYVNAMAIYRDSRYDATTFLSDSPRHDTQKMLIAAVGAPRWTIGGFYPEIRFKRVINRSNLLYYGYRQSEVSLNFKYNF